MFSGLFVFSAKGSSEAFPVPDITCPSDTIIDCPENTLPSNTGMATAPDICDTTVMITFNDTIVDGACPQEYTIMRTWLATDDCGNTSTCLQMITVQDTTMPVLICMADTIINCTENTLPANTGTSTATDNCDPEVVVTYTDATISGSCPQNYTINRTWVATDECGNTSTCLQMITVQDTTKPVLVCEADTILNCTENTLPANTGTSMATDNCDPEVMVTYTDATISGSCPQNYTINRTWLATDDCGNTSSCLQVITVQDTPVLVCAADTILNCTENTLPANTGTSTATDNCDPEVMVTYTDATINGSCPQNYTINRTWVATNNCGNTSSCLQVITVQDTTNPVVVCAADTILNCTENTLPANTGTSSATDNCDPEVVVTYTDATINGSCPQNYTINRTWVATDDCGNTSSCLQMITVQDTTKPVLVCVADTIIDCTENTLPANTGTSTATDNCDSEVLVSYTDETVNVICPQNYTINRTWVATDECGNTSTCVQLIMVQNSTPPVIVCPGDLTVVSDPVATPNPSPGPNTYYTIANGNWNSAATWINGNVPNADNLSNEIIFVRHTVNYNLSSTFKNNGILRIEPLPGTTADMIVPSGINFENLDGGRVFIMNGSYTQYRFVGGGDTGIPQSGTFKNVNGKIRAIGSRVEVAQDWTSESGGTRLFANSCLFTGQNFTVSGESTKDTLINSSISIAWFGSGNFTLADGTIRFEQPIIQLAGTSGSFLLNSGTANGDIDYITLRNHVTDNTGSGKIEASSSLNVAGGLNLDAYCANEYNPNGKFSGSQTLNCSLTDVYFPAMCAPEPLSSGCEAVLEYLVTSSDNCGTTIVYQISGLPSGSSFPIGTTTNIFVADDGCNTDTCSFSITVLDDVPPTISCPADITIECTANTLPPATGTATASDFCDTVVLITFTDDILIGSCPQAYTITRTWTAVDDNGNTTTCDQIIEVEDSTPPFISCPPDITIQCTDSSDPDDTGTATATDNCDESVVPDILSNTIVAGSCPQQFTIRRVWRATDDCGNSSTCLQIIAVVDLLSPVITCPANITIQCSSSTLPPATGSATAVDNCDPSVTISFNDTIANDSCAQEYTITRTWRATDDCGNTHECVQMIVVRDTIIPVIVCPVDTVINCMENTLPSTTGNATATDNCDPSVAISYTDTITDGSCAQEYTITRIWLATDDFCNTTSCIQVIMVQDTTGPFIVCPADTVIDCLGNTLPSATGNATATDNCDTDIPLTYSDVTIEGNCPQEYTITRTWLTEDNCGNTSSCFQVITVQDTTKPVLVCVADTIINCTENSMPVNTGTPSAADNCGPAVVVTYTDATINGSCPQNFTINRTWMATDDCGNTSSCLQVITVQDTTKPVLECVADTVINCTENLMPVNTGTPSASDNCDLAVVVSYTDATINGSCPQNYTINRTWVASDDCGNTSSCLQVIMVQDTTKPVIICVSDTIINCTENVMPVNTGTPLTADNCDLDVMVIYTDATISGSCPQNYIINRTWVATDDCGNTSSCLQVITVQDTTKPVIVCAADTIINCTENTLPGNTGISTATDNCDPEAVVTYTDETINGSCPQNYIINRTWLATDECGNSTSCLQVIIVQDTTKPVLVCAADTIINCTENSLPANTGTSTASDNCDLEVIVTYTDATINGSCPQSYTINRTWLATDECGNTSSCLQLIMVQDTTKPFITCPPDITIIYPASTLPSNTGTATATDNCDTSAMLSYTDALPPSCSELNTIIRTWTATDDCGNSSSCQQSILIEDHGSICGKVEDDLGQALDSIMIQLISDVNNNEVYDAGDTLVAVTLSDSAGNYCFTDIKPCNYILVEIQPLTYGDLYDYDTTPDPDGNDSLDGPDNEIPVTLGQGETDSENIFIDIVCPTLLPVIPPDTICDGDSIIYETSPLNPGPLTYTWSFGSGSTPTSAMGLGPHTVSFVTTTDNQMGGAIIMLTVSKSGCPDLTGQVSSAEINPYPNAAINGSTSNLCYYTDRIFQPFAAEIPGATYNWNFGSNAVPLTATGYGPHTVYYTVSGLKTVSLVIYPNAAGAQCPDSSSISFNVTNCPGNITGTVKSVTGIGIQGVNIRLYADSNEDGVADNNIPVSSVFSTSNGSYSMVNLTPASYVIVQTQPPLWSSVDDEDTSDDGDPVPNIDSLDNLIPATLNPSEIDGHNIFTEIALPGSINGAVFIDHNGDETPDIDEGIEGVVIGLFHDDNIDGQPDTVMPLDTAITTSAGNYIFTNIPIGNYVLIQTQPTGFESVIDIDATNDQDSVPNTNTQDDIIPVTLTNQENDEHNYFIENFECTLVVNSTNDSGEGTLRFMIGCASEGDTILFDSSLEGQTILLTSSKIEIVKDLVIQSQLIPRITIASEISGLFDIGLNHIVEFRDLDIISGVTGNSGAAFRNFGTLIVHNINILRNPLLPPGDNLVHNMDGSHFILTGNCFLKID